MNSYYDPNAAQAVYEERIRKYREAADLGRPRKARHNRQTSQVRTRPGISAALQTMARAVYGFLV
jgi:hypothetical protein